MDLAQHLSASIDSVSSQQERKISNFALFIQPKKNHLEYRPIECQQ